MQGALLIWLSRLHNHVDHLPYLPSFSQCSRMRTDRRIGPEDLVLNDADFETWPAVPARHRRMPGYHPASPSTFCGPLADNAASLLGRRVTHVHGSDSVCRRHG